MSLLIKPHSIDSKNCINNNSPISISKANATSTDKDIYELKDPGSFRFPDNYPKHLQSRFLRIISKSPSLPMSPSSNSNSKSNSTPINKPPIKIISITNSNKTDVKSDSSCQLSSSNNSPMEIQNEPINNNVFFKCNGRDEEEMEIPLYIDFEEKTVVDNQESMQLCIVIPKKKEEYILDVNNIPSGIAGSQTILFHIVVDDDFVEINGQVEGCDNIVEAIKKDIL